MSNSPIQQVGKVRDRSNMDGVTEPGAFTVFNDRSAIFTGNGQTTFSEATAHLISHLGKEDKTLGLFRDNRDAASLGARDALQKNPTLKDHSPDDAVPRGKQFDLDGVSLKAILAPFVDKLDQLRDAALNFEASPGGKNAKITGQVRSKGLGLPTDPRI